MNARTGATTGRLELAVEARRLRDEGFSIRGIGDVLGCSRSYASELLNDPDGSKARARKDRYAGICVDCGGPTSGCEGRGPNAPQRCWACNCEHLRVDHPHGTIGRYQKGCSCEDCRAANRERGRRLKGKTPPRHGVSGYQNYGCRCATCTKAHSDYLFLTANSVIYARRKKAA